MEPVLNARKGSVKCALEPRNEATRDYCCVFTKTVFIIFYTDFGAYGVRVISIPFYATSSEQQIQYMIQDANVKFLFVGEQEQYDKARRINPFALHWNV